MHKKELEKLVDACEVVASYICLPEENCYHSFVVDALMEACINTYSNTGMFKRVREALFLIKGEE